MLDELVDAFAELLKVGEELSVPERELEEEADIKLVTEWVLDGDSEGELDGLRETVGLCEAETEELGVSEGEMEELGVFEGETEELVLCDGEMEEL